MRLLLITHSFPPHEDPRAFRWGAIVDHWRKQGVIVDVITANRGIDAFPSAIPAGSSLRARFASRGPTNLASGHAKLESTPARFKQAIRWAYRRTWHQIQWPDYAALWIRPAIRVARRQLRLRRYDGLITVSNPFSCHLVGQALKRSHPQLPWIVDIGDPFAAASDAPVNNRRLYGRRNWFAESSVLKSASSITVTTEATRELYSDTFAQVGAKVRVIPPVLTLESSPSRNTAKESGPRRIAFFGMLYRSLRNPRGILQAFHRLRTSHELKDWELHFYGRLNDCDAEFDRSLAYIDASVVLHGQVPRTEAMTAMRDCDVLLNIGNANSVQLPSKLVEYVATGKPIINVSSHPQDASSAFLRDYPAAITISNFTLQHGDHGLNELAGFLTHPPHVANTDIERILAPYQLNRIADRYLEVLERSSDGKRRAA